MSVVKKGASALGKLLVLIALAATFVVGLVGVVYMSLQGEEIKVPEIVGKDLNQSEQELAALGLQIKKRASRPSAEKINTILEQLPKAGETVKTGQKILVVVSEAGSSGEDIPATIKKSSGAQEEDDTEKIEELISDKPKKSNKTNANANSNKKKTSTTRDVLNNNSNGANSNSGNSNSNSSSGNSAKDNKNAATNSNKNAPAPDAKKPGAEPKPAIAKPATGGDVRPRKTP